MPILAVYKKRSRAQVAGAVIAVLAVIGIVGWLAVRAPEQQAKRVARAPTTATASAQAQPAFAPGAVAAPASAASAARVITSKSAEVDRLSKTGDPKDAFAAYELLFACADARISSLNGPHLIPEFEAQRQKMPTPAEVCGDITPGQIASRRALVMRAAEAGVHGAVARLQREGAYSMETKHARGPDEPEGPEEFKFADQLGELSKLSAATGDREALRILSLYYGLHGDKVMELAAVIATDAADKADTGKNYGPLNNIRGKAKMTLPPEEYRRALDEGARLVQQAERYRASGR